ncbi:hypothetical protein BH11ARM2_BH11ARM2_37730 [soil metagenome]
MLAFAFFGCNRVDAKDIDPVRNPSSANRAQLERTLSEVADARCSLLFAGGDLVNNYGNDDGTLLQRQIWNWSREVATLPKSIPIVAVPGNHELNKKVGDQRTASTLTYPRWKTWLTANGFLHGTNGPTPANDPEDALAMDESKMSYTLDRSGVRFIVLNTDTRTTTADPLTGTTLGWIPAVWASHELEKAERDPAVKAVFMIGHRNLIDPTNVIGDAPIDAKASKTLVAAMRGKRKFRAYVCAHVHAWNVRPIPGTRAVQIISGDGGSKLEKGAEEEFGWVEVQVHADGTAGYIHHHRPMPHPYNSPDPAPASTVDPEIRIG